MSKTLIISMLAGACLGTFGCGSSTPANNKALDSNPNSNLTVTNAIVPPASPLTTSADTPISNVPDHAVPAKSPTSPVGNMNANEPKKPVKPDTRPSPSGIPDAEAIRKALGQPATKPANSNSSMMMMKKKPANTP